MKKFLFAIFILNAPIALLDCLPTHEFSSFACQAQERMSLDDCIKYALEHNVDIKQRAIDISVKKQTVQEKKNAYLPDVQATLSERVGYGNVGTAGDGISTESSDKYGLSFTELGVSSSMPLYTGGSLTNDRKAAEFNLESTIANLEAARKDVSMQVAAKFLQALYYKNLAEVSRKQCAVSEELLKMAKAKVEDGKSPASEEANASAKLASDLFTKTQDEGNATLALVNLAQMLTLPSPENFDISEAGLMESSPSFSAMPMSAAQIYENCACSYPTIAAAKASISEAEANVKVAEAKRLPSVDLRANISTNYSNIFNKGITNAAIGKQLFDNNHFEWIGVYVTFPIFNRWATRTSINRAKLQVESQRAALEGQQQKLRNDIQQAYYNARVSVDRYEAALKAKDAADISFGYEKTKYDEGRSTIFDLSLENQRWLKAQQDELQAKYEYLIRMKILDFYKNN